ncbi:MAG: Jag N-terminal domain-containing protein, partial [Candidatus Latescibacterota bacterium]
VRSIIQEGESVAEAVAQALDQLARSEEEVTIEVLDRPKKGWLGFFGTHPVRIKATERNPEEIKIALIEKLTKELLQLLQTEATVQARTKNGVFHVSVHPEKDTGLIIGKHGQTIDALEHVLGKMVRTRLQDMTRITLDVADYRDRQLDKVRRDTLQAVRKALSSNDKVVTEALTTDGLKAALSVIAKSDKISYTLIGQGLYKNIILSARREAPPKS